MTERHVCRPGEVCPTAGIWRNSRYPHFTFAMSKGERFPLRTEQGVWRLVGRLEW